MTQPVKTVTVPSGHEWTFNFNRTRREVKERVGDVNALLGGDAALLAAFTESWTYDMPVSLEAVEDVPMADFWSALEVALEWAVPFLEGFLRAGLKPSPPASTAATSHPNGQT